jgi:hypothetical protein
MTRLSTRRHAAAAVSPTRARARRILFVALLISSTVLTQAPLCSARPQDFDKQAAPKAQSGGRVEPGAGDWRTWVISSGRDYRVPPPPNPAETQAELRALADLIGRNDAQARQQIAFWDAGAPPYRWVDLINARLLAGTPTTQYPHRVYTYVALAMYDATVAAWESKYYYDRRRPSE